MASLPLPSHYHIPPGGISTHSDGPGPGVARRAARWEVTPARRANLETSPPMERTGPHAAAGGQRVVNPGRLGTRRARRQADSIAYARREDIPNAPGACAPHPSQDQAFLTGVDGLSA